MLPQNDSPSERMQVIVVQREVHVPVEVIIGCEVKVDAQVGRGHHIIQHLHPHRSLKGDLLRQVVPIERPPTKLR